ncbi:MAG: HAMP domain-containing sensor histidine kinase [Pseudomonadota bacterium]
MDICSLFNGRSLSIKLLILTILFVFMAEIVVMIPSVAKERVSWLETRVEEAYLVSLAFEGAQGSAVNEETARQLFATANILGVTVNRGDMRMLIVAPEIDPHGPQRLYRVDLRDAMPTTKVTDAWGTVFSRGDELIQVTGAPRFARDQVVDIIISQQALRRDLNIYARNILLLSLVISSFTAALVYWALNRIIVKPVRTVTKNMTAFEADPDRAALIYAASERTDEIGAAERSLEAMQRRLHELLGQRRRLATLGAGISKISHDLRNILASAQLMSDRLAKSDDPRVRQMSPRLLSALDRAITLSRDTLAFGRMDAQALDKTPVNLRALIEDVFEDSAALGIRMENGVSDDFTIIADRTHLHRSLMNLCRNAVEAMSASAPSDATDDTEMGGINVTAGRTEAGAIICVEDTGPGVPEYAQETLFEPFKGTRKPGGSGLGLAIASEIATAHGGALTLEETGPDGTRFELFIPAA